MFHAIKDYDQDVALCPHTQSTLCEDPVYLHSSCALLHTNPGFVVFQEIFDSSKLYMRGVCSPQLV